MKGKRKNVYTLKLSSEEFRYIKTQLTTIYNLTLENSDISISEAFPDDFFGVDLGILLEEFDNLDP